MCNVKLLTSAESYDAANRIVGGNADRDAVTRNDLDTEPAHPPAQLRQDFMPGVALHAIQTAGVDRHHGSLHINQVVFAQTALPFGRSNQCATSYRASQRILPRHSQHERRTEC